MEQLILKNQLLIMRALVKQIKPCNCEQCNAIKETEELKQLKEAIIFTEAYIRNVV
jgi:hypothetical protein